MIPVPVWTVEKPINLLDYLTPFYEAAMFGKHSERDLRRYAQAVPTAISEAPKFQVAFREALAAVQIKRAAA